MSEEDTVEVVLDDIALKQGPTCPFIKYRNEWIAFLLVAVPTLLILIALL
jgi:hypothetical protein